MPTGTESTVSPEVHTASREIVGHGTLPAYRSPDHALSIDVNLRGSRAKIRDNFVFVEITADDHREALSKATDDLTAFLQHLSLETHRAFTFEPLYLQTSDGTQYALPVHVSLGQYTLYNLEHMAAAVHTAADRSALQDPSLERALEYFEHAVYLFEHRSTIAPVRSRHFRYLISSVFLTLWKAVSTVVGDPSVDKDYQRRYKTLGFDQTFFAEKIERLRGLRNNYDVAHYHLSAIPLRRIEESYGEAVVIASDILWRYRSHLAEEPVHSASTAVAFDPEEPHQSGRIGILT